MRLLELTADRPSFRTVKFNRTGLTLIIGGREASTKDGTTNGVGKSLLVHLVHFCLGTNRVPVLEEALPDWTFTLTFEAAGSTHRVSRSTSDQNTILLDEGKTTLKEYRKLLTQWVFHVPEGLTELTFRALIPYFLRPSRKAYAAFDNANPAVNDYRRLLHNGFLLGLDPLRIKTKHDLRVEHEEMRKYRANFEKDPVIRDILTGGMELELELSAASEDVANLPSFLRPSGLLRTITNASRN